MERENQYYVMVNGEKVFVTKEVRDAYMRPLWQEDKRRERESRCVSVSGKGVCWEDCSLCLKGKSPRVISLDSIQADGSGDLPSSARVEEMAERNELYSALHLEINQLPDAERRLIHMEMAGVHYLKAAAALGIPLVKYYRQRNRAFGLLRQRLKNFFDAK